MTVGDARLKGEDVHGVPRLCHRQGLHYSRRVPRPSAPEAHRLFQTARPRRSVLYVPGANLRAMEKSKTLAADVLIFDLEDAVAPDAKRDARIQVVNAVKA